MRSFLKTVLCLFLALSAAGCAKNSNEIVIGEYASMTGGTAPFGQSSHRGAALATEEINAAGGLPDKKIRLITEDDQSRPE